MKLMLYYIKRHIVMFLIAVVFFSIETFADFLQPASIITRITNDVSWRRPVFLLCVLWLYLDL